MILGISCQICNVSKMLHVTPGEFKVDVLVICGYQTFSLRSHFQKNYKWRILFNTVHLPPDIHRIFNTCVPYVERRNFSRLKLSRNYPNLMPEPPMLTFLECMHQNGLIRPRYVRRAFLSMTLLGDWCQLSSKQFA